MKDHEARVRIAAFEQKVEYLERQVERLESVGAKEELKDLSRLIRMFRELVKELGFSYDEHGVFEREVANSASALGRLQLQITALVNTFGLEEVWSGGTLRYREVSKR